MDQTYTYRKATLADIDFIVEVIINAEKSMTNNLGLGSFFGLTEEEVISYLKEILSEEIDGCEFSISSFFVACYDNKAVAALGGWLEGHDDEMPSALLKSNLIGTHFPIQSIIAAKDKLDIIKDIQIEREFGAYQLEYSYVDEHHRGKRLTNELMRIHLEHAKTLNPEVKKAQLHVFENNKIIIGVHEKSGFAISKRFESNNPEITNYLPHNVKLLMEKPL